MITPEFTRCPIYTYQYPDDVPWVAKVDGPAVRLCNDGVEEFFTFCAPEVPKTSELQSFRIEFVEDGEGPWADCDDHEVYDDLDPDIWDPHATISYWLVHFQEIVETLFDARLPARFRVNIHYTRKP